MIQHADAANADVEKPWYRQFWPWFLIALPATAVVAGLTTLTIAILNQDSLVQDDWYKDGKAINQSFARDNLATSLALTADLRLDDVTGEVQVRVSGKNGFLPPASLMLVFSHPTQAHLDQTVALTRRADGHYQGVLQQGLKGSYYIELGNTEWRLRNSRDFPLPELTLLHE